MWVFCLFVVLFCSGLLFSVPSVWFYDRLFVFFFWVRVSSLFVALSDWALFRSC